MYIRIKVFECTRKNLRKKEGRGKEREREREREREEEKWIYIEKANTGYREVKIEMAKHLCPRWIKTRKRNRRIFL